MQLALEEARKAAQEEEVPVGAVAVLEEVQTEALQTPVQLVRVHAFGLRERFEQAAAAFHQLTDDIPVALRELRDELHRRFVARSGQLFNNAWLLDQETSFLLSPA